MGSLLKLLCMRGKAVSKRPAAYQLRVYLFSTPRHAGRPPNSWQRISLMGFSSPLRFSQSCPHCLRRFVHARTVAGQKYLPTPSYGRAGSCPALIADVCRSHPCGGLGASTIVAFRAIGGMGKVFDGLSILLSMFSERDCFPRWVSIFMCRLPEEPPHLLANEKAQNSTPK